VRGSELPGEEQHKGEERSEREMKREMAVSDRMSLLRIP
jgi:hypothetical protein